MLKGAVGKVMWVGRATVFLVGLAVILALTLGAASVALGANGKPFILGKGNVATKVSTLTNNGLGAALGLNVQDGQPPLAVNSSAKVANLNADLLDGQEASAFQPAGSKAADAEMLDGRDSSGFVQTDPSSAQAGSIHINGMVRSGSETGTSEPATAGLFLPGNYDGMVVRRVASTNTTAGQVIAKTDALRLERDGTFGGLRVAWNAGSSNSAIACTGVNSSGDFVGKAANIGGTTPSQFPLFTNDQNLVFLNCSFGDSFGAEHTTQITMQRTSNDNYWVGSLVSSINQ